MTTAARSPTTAVRRRAWSLAPSVIASLIRAICSIAEAACPVPDESSALATPRCAAAANRAHRRAQAQVGVVDRPCDAAKRFDEPVVRADDLGDLVAAVHLHRRRADGESAIQLARGERVERNHERRDVALDEAAQRGAQASHASDDRARERDAQKNGEEDRKRRAARDRRIRDRHRSGELRAICVDACAHARVERRRAPQQRLEERVAARQPLGFNVRELPRGEDAQRLVEHHFAGGERGRRVGDERAELRIAGRIATQRDEIVLDARAAVVEAGDVPLVPAQEVPANRGHLEAELIGKIERKAPDLGPLRRARGEPLDGPLLHRCDDADDEHQRRRRTQRERESTRQSILEEPHHAKFLRANRRL